MLKYASKRKCLFYLNCKVWCYNKADIATDLSLSGRGFLALITFFLFCFYLSQWKCLNLFIIFLVRINKTSMSFVLKTLWSKLKIMKNIVCNFGLNLIGLVRSGNSSATWDSLRRPQWLEEFLEGEFRVCTWQNVIALVTHPKKTINTSPDTSGCWNAFFDPTLRLSTSQSCPLEFQLRDTFWKSQGLLNDSFSVLCFFTCALFFVSKLW